MRIGVLSDTHDLLRPEAETALQGCDCILHAGDISSPTVLERLGRIASVKAVRGNNDKGMDLPAFLEADFQGRHICMAHKRKDLPRDLAPYDAAICGHTHRYVSETITDPGTGRRTLLLNPGSCGPRLLHQPVTLAILTIGRDSIICEKKEIPHPEAVSGKVPGDIREQIVIVMRETEKGRSPSDIARRYRIDPAAAEQIARLYVTHPGVTPDGIMSKMGI